MSTEATVKMLSMYKELAGAPSFLSSLFMVNPGNIYDQDEFEIDIERDIEMVAPAVANIDVEGNPNEASKFVNKKFKGTPFKETAMISAKDLSRRVPGNTPFDSIEMRKNIAAQVLSVSMKIANKLRRAVELQSAEVLTTGIITNRDNSWTTLDTTTFSPKAGHYANAALVWSNASSDKLADITALAQTIQNNGKRVPNVLIFGTDAWAKFIADPKVQVLFNLWRAQLGEIKPIITNEGAIFQGTIAIGSYMFQMYTYNAVYVTPAAPNTSVPFLAANKVIVMAKDARRDATYGTVPMLPGYENEPALSYIPRQVTPALGGPAGVAFNIGAYPNQSRTAVSLWVASRILMVPTAIDTHGCLTT